MHPTSIMSSLSPVPTEISTSPLPSFETNESSVLDISQNTRESTHEIIASIVFYVGFCFALFVILFAILYFRYIYKLVMDKIGYDFREPMHFDTATSLRIASLEECIQHFWKYRGVICNKGLITDDLFTHYGNIKYEQIVLNALNHVCMNPNILCPVSYYKVVCHMADRKSETIRNKAFETLLHCKSMIPKCVTVEFIQLLNRMFVESSRPSVKEHAVSILFEISRSNPNLITFNTYEMLRSCKFATFDTTLTHSIQVTLQEIRQNCVHLHLQIRDYEKLLCDKNYFIPSNCQINNESTIEVGYEISNEPDIALHSYEKSKEIVIRCIDDSDESEDDDIGIRDTKFGEISSDESIVSSISSSSSYSNHSSSSSSNSSSSSDESDSSFMRSENEDR
jgi:hypothetical protein